MDFCVRGMLSLFLALCFTKDPIIISTTGTDKVRIKQPEVNAGKLNICVDYLQPNLSQFLILKTLHLWSYYYPQPHI